MLIEDRREWRLGQLHASAVAGRRPKHSGATRWLPPAAASGSFSAPSTAKHLIGTVTLLLNLPPNQPHRAEIAKMMTRVSHRHRGIATALLREAERMAIARGRWLLVLDTAEDEGAAGLYERMGFQLTGVIPDYAFKPHGGLTGTLIYWKRLREAVPA